MFEAKCQIVKIKDRGIYVCKCPIICNSYKDNVDIFSTGIQVFVQTFFYKQLGDKNLDAIIDYFKNIYAVFSLYEFERDVPNLLNNTLTFNLTIDFCDTKLKDSITFSVEALLDLIKILKDNDSILGYKLANA